MRISSKMMKCGSMAIVATVLILGGAGKAAAAFQAYSTGNVSGNQGYPGNLGVDFNVNNAISITSLGAYDDGQNGFSNPITVGLYRRPTANPDFVGPGTLITSIVLSGTSGTLSGNYRFGTLSTPVVLQPGFYDVDAVGFSGADLNGNENNAGFTIVTNDGGGRISFVGTGRFDGNGFLNYPVQSSADLGFPGLTPHPFAGGSFQFTAAPEPANLTLLGFGGVTLLGYAGLRRRKTLSRAV